MRYDVIVVGGGTAGCVLAARLSESAGGSVCLLEAGPDYGSLAEGRWPAELLDPRSLPQTHGWGTGGEDGRPLGGRVIGGSSSVNACMVVAGSPADYAEWGHGWSYDDLAPFLRRAAASFRTAPSNDELSTPFHAAFLEAAEASGFRRLPDPNAPSAPVGVAPFPANVADGRRWNAAFAYLDEARSRANLTILGDTLVDRVELTGRAATGVLCADGRRIEGGIVVLTAGAYFSPAILLRSGIGPEQELRRLGISLVEALPVGERLLDHCGTDVAWELSAAGTAATRADERTRGLREANAFVKAASSSCEPERWNLHLLPWVYAGGADAYRASIIVFHMKPRSSGRIRLRSPDPVDPPLVERGFLNRHEDLPPLLEGIDLSREIGASEPLRDWIGTEVAPGETDPEQYIRATVRNYFHPAGTCPLGTVVDTHGRVFGVERLYVADASFMPTIPRANTNLTTAAIAEKIAATI